MRRTGVILAALATAFLLRVLGQVVVWQWAPEFLPPMEAWYSGLVPYSVLLPAQLVILALQVRVSIDLWRGRGRFSRRWPRFGLGLRWFSYVYAVGMVLRFGLTTRGRIPIFFHWVLAAYCYVWSRFHTRAVPA